MTAQPGPRLADAARLRSQWERAREDVAMLIANKNRELQTLYGLIALQDDQHREMFGKEPPEFELSIRRVS